MQLRASFLVASLASCREKGAAHGPDAALASQLDARVEAAVEDTARPYDAFTPNEDAGATQGPRPGSCYGRCGTPELLADHAACACDPGCFTREDCCADKHELCAVSARTPLCTLTGRELDPAQWGADLGWTFAHDGQVEVLFGDSYGYDGTDPFPHDDSQGTLPLARPELIPARPTGPLACGSLLQLDKKPAPLGRQTFAPTLLYEEGAALSSSLGETPLTGFSDGAHAYLIARRGHTIDTPIYIGWRDPSAAPGIKQTRTIYRSGVKVDMPHFRNPTAVTVDATLYLFGRGNFAGEDATRVYLARHDLPLVHDAGMRWTPSYFTGLTADGPRWSQDAAQAQPILSGDFQRTMQFDVAWVSQLNKWVMLYGGDVADWIDAASDADQPRHGALHMRMADAPWGPWTRPAPVFWREHAAAFLHCDDGCDLDELPDDPDHGYAPGSWAPQLRDFPGCIRGSLTPSQPNFVPGSVLPCAGAQRGNLYGPSMLESWTADLAGDQGYPHAATLYFLVSTWMPYQVILASLTVHLP